MMKRTMRALATILFLICLTTPFAFADHGGGFSLQEKYFEKVHFLMSHREDLGLSEEQIEQLINIKMAVKRVWITENSKMELAALDIMQELHKDAPDLEKINALIDQKLASKKVVASAMAKAIVDTKGALSAEQIKKMKELYWKAKTQGTGHAGCSQCPHRS